ncbi:hypothetical protein [Methylobacterium sp. JK268]
MSDGKDQVEAGPAASAETRLKDAVTSARAALPKMPRLRLRLGLPVAAALAGGLCVGSLGGAATVVLLGKGLRAERPAIALAEWKKLATRLDAQAAESARIAGDLKQLREKGDAARDAAAAGRTETGTRLGQIAERIDRLAKVGTETTQKLAAVTEKLDHLDREQQARVAALGEKLERQHVATAAPAPAPTPTPAPVQKAAAAEPVQTGALPDKPAAKAAPAPAAPAAPGMVESWVLRDVYDGVAMIENRNRRLIEVGPGDTVPGVGRVEAIERRGKTFVVVTSRGLIGPQIW